MEKHTKEHSHDKSDHSRVEGHRLNGAVEPRRHDRADAEREATSKDEADAKVEGYRNVDGGGKAVANGKADANDEADASVRVNSSGDAAPTESTSAKVGTRAQKLIGRVRSWIEANPLASVGIALSVGFFAGRFVRVVARQSRSRRVW
jgi:ElaB/YqjD/DUF883 family membrane-anchored ribosome-binding protein